MKELVVVEIDGPLEEVAALYADPNNNTKWMEDVERTFERRARTAWFSLSTHTETRLDDLYGEGC